MALTHSAPAAARTASFEVRAAVRFWLIAVAGLVFLMVLVGGATRLTESGLSITQWKPVTGVIPPLSGAEWQAEFDRYKQIPQFATLNPDMTLDGFKTIFWWEWGHRLLARVVGAAFIIPGLWFWRRGQLKGALGRQVAVATGLLALEPIVGWWMVTSGLSERTEVAQQRLALHLMIAAATFGALIYAAVGLGERPRSGATAGRAASRFRPACSPRWSSASSASAPWSRACAPASSTIPGRSWDRASIPGEAFKPSWLQAMLERPGDGAVRSSTARLCDRRLRAPSSRRRASRRARLAAREPRRRPGRGGACFRSALGVATLLSLVPDRTGAGASGARARALRPRHRPPSRDRDGARPRITHSHSGIRLVAARLPRDRRKMLQTRLPRFAAPLRDTGGSGAPEASRGKLRCRM